MHTVKLSVLFLIILTLTTMTGCFGSRETDETGYVMAVGFDKGEKDNVLLTIAIANPKLIAGMSSGGGGSGQESSKDVILKSVEAYGPLNGIEMLKTTTSRHLSLLHTKAFIFSEEIAQEGLADWFRVLSRYFEVRGTAYAFVCKGKAKDLMGNNYPILEVIPSKQYELSDRLSESHGFYHDIMIKDFNNAVRSTSIQPSLPIIAIHENGLNTVKPGIKDGGDIALGKYIAGEIPIEASNKTQLGGMALFKQDKMIGVINGEESRYYLMLRGIFKRGYFNIRDPLAEKDQVVGVVARQAGIPKYKARINEDGSTAIDVSIYLEADLAALLGSNSYESDELRPLLEAALAKQIQEGCQKLVQHTQEEFGSDIFGFGEQFKGQFWTLQDWHDFKWLQRYPDTQVNVAVHTRIKRTGLHMKTNPAYIGE